MIVVTGATGNIGRPLVEALTTAGEKVVAVSRGDAAFPDGVLHRKADLADTATLKSAFEGGGKLFLLTIDPELDHAPILEAAAAAGIGHVVLVSSERVVTRPTPALEAFERAVTDSGLEWTILRPGGFASNSLLWAESVRKERKVLAPFGDVGLPVIDPRDIAHVAAAALTGDGHAGKAYLLTGPALITPRRQAEAIAAAIGEPVQFVEQRRAEAYAQLARFWPDHVVEDTLDIIGNPNAAEQEISGDVERVLGRPAAAFADWAQRNAAAFR
ncbi:NAD(P)H-binding protein [Glycomyces luteolus]|uniref:NAD(P)H-binding protein n=1 Tax=Glycomyces luteolus TaxID=2670330 RepID=A0A9X3P5A0_9ACTN|nr:NAD(P)H-binding protein [Glycomyces luteolus]MDA1358983.1 NAD(P)H-binding protein [Glycomyces luteolus]